MKSSRRGLKWILYLILMVAIGFGCFSIYLEFALRRSLLQARQLPLSLFHLLKAGSLIRQIAVDDIPSVSAKEYFSEGISYASLLADGKIRISIYVEPIAPIVDWSSHTEEIQERAKASDVILRILPDMEAFQDALQNDDVVLFYGHSNFGQGLNVYSESLQTNVLWRVAGSKIQDSFPEKFRLTEERFIMGEMPKIESAVYIHLGCRSMIYYREAFLNNSSEQSSFLLTHFEWAPGFRFHRAVDLLCQTLEKRQSVQQLMERWEKLYTSELLLGRSRQLKKYPDQIFYPDTLFQWVGSE